MWMRMRLDIGWRDVLFGWRHWNSKADSDGIARRVMSQWGNPAQNVVTLSVRSALDLMLRALALRPGSEVLMSAVTVPDMVRIVQHHRLVPVPVDIDSVGRIDPASLAARLNDRTRMLIVAHLFGYRMPMGDIVECLRGRDILLVEDCAQSLTQLGQTGHSASHMTLFSFGPIKTATALGGGLAVVRDPGLRQRMLELSTSDPPQSDRAWLKRLSRFAMIKALSYNIPGTVLQGGLRACRIDSDRWINGLGRGFRGGDIVQQIRRQPAAGLLHLLEHRLKTYDWGRIDRRRQLGRTMDRLIGRWQPEEHTYWTYPLFVNNSGQLCCQLARAGFDATLHSRLTVVGSSEPGGEAVNAERWFKSMIFLPWFTDLPHSVAERMAGIVLRHADPLEHADHWSIRGSQPACQPG